MGKKIRRKTMSQSQNINQDQNQQTQSAPAAPAAPADQAETSWFASWWKIIVATLLATVIILLSFFAVLKSTENRAYRSGFTAGVEATITTYENTPWYSRWWSGITGTFPGKK